jgi:uncharacterized protein (DUF305 family)
MKNREEEMKMQHGRTRAVALAAVLTLAATLVALTSEVSVRAQDHTGHTGQQQAGDMTPGLHFIDMMLMHHRQGIEMARLAQSKAQSAGVKAFAAKTAAAQEKDLQQLQWHRDNRYAGRPTMDHQQMMAHMSSMPMHGGMKMDMEAVMTKLRAAAGLAFDRLFLDTMSHHHYMAVEMSKDAAKNAEHADIRELARKGALTQQAEIAEMNRLKASLGRKVIRKTAAKPSRKTVAKKPAAKKPAAQDHTHHH